MYFNIIKAIYDKPIANILLNGGKLKPLPLKSGKDKGSTLSTIIQDSLGIPTQSNKTTRRNNQNINRKGRSQTIPICR
jgi:hypothetical protein